MDNKSLGDILGETLFSDTPFKSERAPRTYSFVEEGKLWFPHEVFFRQEEFGSATVLNRGNDLDYLLWGSDLAEGIKYLLKTDWKYTGTNDEYCQVYTEVPFITFRSKCGIYNLVLMEDLDDWKRMMKANDLCVKLKLKNKEDRISVFDAITRKCETRNV
jgi:hypothetical protein